MIYLILVSRRQLTHIDVLPRTEKVAAYQVTMVLDLVSYSSFEVRKLGVEIPDGTFVGVSGELLRLLCGFY